MSKDHSITSPRALIVARVSTDDKGQTTESQAEPLRQAAQRLGWTVAGVVPLEISAWNDDTAKQVREAALAPIRAGQADVLMVWAWDRISREGIQAAFQFLGELENHLGASFYSLQEPFLSTATANKEQRELMLALVAWAAKWESQRKSDRVRAKVESKRADSAKLGQRARWGRGSLPSHEDRLVVSMLRLKGQSLRAISKTTGLGLATVSRICSNPTMVPGPNFKGERGDRSAGSPGTRQNGVVNSSEVTEAT